MSLDEALSVMERAGLRGKVAYVDSATMQALADAYTELDAARAVIADELPATRMANHIMYKALNEIDKHKIGTVTTYLNDDGNADAELCEACGDMREIASQALALVTIGKKARTK